MRRTTLSEFFSNSPDALGFRFKGQFDDGFRTSTPDHKGLACIRGVGKQESEPDGFHERGFTEVVGSVQNVKPGSKLDVEVPNRGKVGDLQLPKYHRRGPAAAELCCSIL